MIIASSLPSSIYLSLVFVSSEHGPVVFWCPSLFGAYSLVCFSMMKFLRVKMFSSRVIFLLSWRNPLPSILMSTLDIPSRLLSNMCLAKNFSRLNGSVSCGCLEVDESMPSVDTVFSVRNQKAYICLKCCDGWAFRICVSLTYFPVDMYLLLVIFLNFMIVHVPWLWAGALYLPLTFMWASATHWLGYVFSHYKSVWIVTKYGTCITEKWQALFSGYC